MQRTKIGISAGLLGAGIYFTGLFSGYLIPIILTFYVLWFEENGWLRRTAVKAVSVMILFSMITLFVNLFPDFLGIISSFVGTFGVEFYYSSVNSLFDSIVKLIDLMRNILILILGFKAFGQSTIYIPVIDNLLSIVVDTLGTFTIRLELSDGKGKKLYSAKFLCEVP